MPHKATFHQGLHCLLRQKNTFLSPRFFKKALGILQSPPSVRPSVCLSVRLSVRQSVRHAISSLTIGRNPTKFGVCVAHMNGACNGTFFFGPAPWGPGEGPKGQISLNIIKFQLLSQFQRFLNQTLCVFSQIKDI